MDINIERKMNAIFDEISIGFEQLKHDQSSEIEIDLLLDQIKKFYVLVKKNQEITTFEMTEGLDSRTASTQYEPKIETAVEKSPITSPPVIESTPVIETIESPVEQKISTSKIMDFLHKEEQPKKEISEFLDFNTRIGLVQNFFKGNALELSECLMAMNKTNSESESVDILQYYASKLQIDPKSDSYLLFLDIIKRRFK